MLVFPLMIIILFEAHVYAALSNDDDWTGQVFPDINKESPSDKEILKDHHGRIPMGVKNSKCDWGEDPKEFDGDLGPQSYICVNSKSAFKPDPTIHPILRKDYIPKGFIPWHHCMNETIIYDKVIPTFGDHRPLWPRFGEYTFLPKQRWVHSLEHGSIVMLYHPCADKNEVNTLRDLLKGCLYQYVITALNELSKERPLALVAWGVSLEMSKVDNKTVIDFIQNHAHKAPEKVTLDGQYNKNLIVAAPTDLRGKEDHICSNN
ncbi:uncharacterized protein LOC123313797 [Coccinella septempunctata]|uniref:uncharacterized protein LOC123313797 n=1 Tax=Coccinella septempunctata TaxID=41139 RepID=UPI001D07361D|nr:uncharacterized protein LOC123313797 [Coccinella septempunctata]